MTRLNKDFKNQYILNENNYRTLKMANSILIRYNGFPSLSINHFIEDYNLKIFRKKLFKPIK